MKVESHLLIALLIVCSAVARAANDLEIKINERYVGKILVLRRFCDCPRLRFGPDGMPIDQIGRGTWTTDAEMEIRHLTVKDDVLEIQGRRVRLFYDPATKEMRDVSLASRDQIKTYFRRLKSKKAQRNFNGTSAEVDLNLTKPPQQEADLVSAIETVFVTTDHVADIVPDFWKDFVSGKDIEHSLSESPEFGPIVTADKLTRPAPTYMPDPEYNDIARTVGYQGEGVLWVIVSPKGRVEATSIKKPLGLGLDERAVDAISHWQFNPARKDGVPVPVRVAIQITFHLY